MAEKTSIALTFDEDTRLEREQYYRFVAGSGGNWSEWSGCIFTGNSTRNPTTETVAATGYYTPDARPWERLEEDGTTSLGITLWRIVDGKVTQQWERVKSAAGEYKNVRVDGL